MRIVCIFVFIGTALIGLPSCFGFSIWSHIKPLGLDDILTFFDFASNSVLMPIVAILTCVFIGFIIKPQTLVEEIEEGGMKFGRKKLFVVMIKYVAPICIVLILVSSILDVLGIVKI